jgi:hypothetical protein
LQHEVRSTPPEWLEQGIDYSFWFSDAETGEFGGFYLWAKPWKKKFDSTRRSSLVSNSLA